jgi:hypothetical protein
MQLDTSIIPVNELDAATTESLFKLMWGYYLNVDRRQFDQDLSEKEYVILLSSGGIPRGFSTWMRFDHAVQGKSVKIIFSGDTIIEDEYRGSLALPMAWGKLMLASIEAQPDTPIYWLLTTKGYKTYRFLPVFFRQFYPSFRGQPPHFERALGTELGQRKYGARFNRETWVIRARPGDQRLQAGVADISPQRLKDEHVAFFAASNPQHSMGDELLCLARCHPENLTPYILRELTAARETENAPIRL